MQILLCFSYFHIKFLSHLNSWNRFLLKSTEFDILQFQQITQIIDILFFKAFDNIWGPGNIIILKILYTPLSNSGFSTSVELFLSALLWICSVLGTYFHINVLKSYCTCRSINTNFWKLFPLKYHRWPTGIKLITQIVLCADTCKYLWSVPAMIFNLTNVLHYYLPFITNVKVFGSIFFLL